MPPHPCDTAQAWRTQADRIRRWRRHHLREWNEMHYLPELLVRTYGMVHHRPDPWRSRRYRSTCTPANRAERNPDCNPSTGQPTGFHCLTTAGGRRREQRAEVVDDPVGGRLRDAEQRGELPQSQVRPPVRGDRQNPVLQWQRPGTAFAHRVRTLPPQRGDEPAELPRAQPAEQSCPRGHRRRDHTSHRKIISPAPSTYGTTFGRPRELGPPRNGPGTRGRIAVCGCPVCGALRGSGCIPATRRRSAYGSGRALWLCPCRRRATALPPRRGPPGPPCRRG